MESEQFDAEEVKSFWLIQSEDALQVAEHLMEKAIATDIEQSVKRFLAALGLRKHVHMAYVYGSQAGGKAMKWSDIDVAIVSSDFSSDLFEERLALMRLAAEIDDRIEPWPFTPETFRSSDPLVSEIRRTGVRVD